MAEDLTVFLTVEDPLDDETEDAVDEAFGALEVRLGGIGEAVGWDLSAEGVQLHVIGWEPERVIAELTQTLHALGAQPPSKLVACDRASGDTLYERSLA
jgi:hypothetical protein